MTQGANYQATASLNIGPFTQAVQQMLTQWNQATAGMKRGVQKTAVNQGFAAALRSELVETTKLNKQMQLQQQRHQNIIAQQSQRHQNIMTQIAARSAAIAKRAAGGGSRPSHFPTHAPAVQKQLINLSSAAQGTMVAFSALQGSIQGVLFGLVFLGWSNLKVSLSFAALALSIGTVVKSARLLLGLATSVGRAWETTGQRLAVSLGSAARAMDVLAKASRLSGVSGLAQTDTRQAIGDLEQLGIASDTYIKALANTAQGTGQTMSEVTKRFNDITLADADQRREMIRQFAKDYKIEVKNYATSLELAMALQDRWRGSMELMAQTQEGLIGRIKSAWTDFGVGVGIVLDGYIKPTLNALLALTQGLAKGFADATKASEATGELQKNAANFNALITVLIPKLYNFGYVIGKVIFKAIQITAQVVKVLADALIRLWNKIKPIIDTLRNLIPKIKELIGWIIAWYSRHKELIDSIGQVLLGLFLFNKSMELLNFLVNIGIGLIGALAKALFGLPLKVISLGIDGVAAALSAIGAIGRALAGLTGKAIDIVAYGLWDFLSGLEQLGAKMKDVAKSVADDAARMAKAFGDAMTEMERSASKGIQVGTNFVTSLTNALLAQAANIAIILANLFTNPAVIAALSNPVVMAVVAAAVVAGLAAAFPYQTGQLTAAFLELLTAMFLAVPILLLSLNVRLATFFVQFLTQVFIGVAKSAWAIIEPVAKTIIENFGQAFSLLKDFLVALITGDWQTALWIALQLLILLFIQMPIDIGQALLEGFKKIATEIVPSMAKAIKDAFVDNFEGMWEDVKRVFGSLWPWVENWFSEFKKGFSDWSGHIFDPLKFAADDLWKAIRGFFSMVGDNAIGKLIAGFFTDITNFINKMPNPFTHFGTYIDWVIDRVNDLIKAYNSIPVLPNVPTIPGGSGNGGGSQPKQESVAQKINAYIISQQDAANGYKTYLIQGSYWSNQIAPAPFTVTTNETPDLSRFTFGGKVPGVPGEKRLVLAEGGEMFGGHPTFNAGRNSGAGISVNVTVKDSVVTNDIVQEIGDKVAKIMITSLAGNRRMMFNRS